MQIRYTVSGFELKAELEKYASSKLAGVRRQLPRMFRPAAKCSVDFKQVVRRGTKISTCQLRLEVGGAVFQANETTQHLYAALDIAAASVEQQVRDYRKRLRSGGLGQRIRQGLRSQWL